MTGWLLDTTVLSEVVRKRPSVELMRRLRTLPADAFATSSICVMELRFGAMRLPHGAPLWERIERLVLPRVRILPVGEREAVLAGDLMARLQKTGRPIGTEDVVIAATALTNGLGVATGNVRHFSQIDGLVVADWTR